MAPNQIEGEELVTNSGTSLSGILSETLSAQGEILNSGAPEGSVVAQELPFIARQLQEDVQKGEAAMNAYFQKELAREPIPGDIQVSHRMVVNKIKDLAEYGSMLPPEAARAWDNVLRHFMNNPRVSNDYNFSSARSQLYIAMKKGS